MENQNNTPAPSSGATMTIEEIFTTKYFEHIDRLSSVWMDNDGQGINENKFYMQMEMLVRLIPDRKKQDAIRKEYDTELAKFPDDDKHRKYKAAMSCVTEVIMFLCGNFDLIHEDIVGPATGRQYKDAAVEIPDIPKPIAEKINGEKS
jgi:hypothetical protein